MQRLTFAACVFAGLAACAPAAQSSPKSTLYVIGLNPPRLVELGDDFRSTRETPLSVPPGCGLNSVFPSWRGGTLALELSCSFGQATLWLNSATGEVRQPITRSDSHFLAWDPSGDAAYLKVDTIGQPRIVRVHLDGRQDTVPISDLTYDLAPKPNGPGFLFSFSGGMGLGSEMWWARAAGQEAREIAGDEANYLSLARWSPDGGRIAFIKVPDSATPFTIGELWLMEADGSVPRPLAKVDAGHGYAPAWSADGSRIAFVSRENPEDARADQSEAALISNLHVVDVRNGEETALTDFHSARVEAPAWQPLGNNVAFTVVTDDRMTVYVVDATSGRLNQVELDSACCPVWVQR